jgi:hypothetical protein
MLGIQKYICSPPQQHHCYTVLNSQIFDNNFFFFTQADKSIMRKSVTEFRICQRISGLDGNIRTTWINLRM